MAGSSRKRSHLGLVLSGGGARGAFHVGVYDRLLKHPRFAKGPAIVSGTSAGAINAAFIAAGKTPKEMMDFWDGMQDHPAVQVSEAFFNSAAWSASAVAAQEAARFLTSTEPLRFLLRAAPDYLPLRPGALLALCAEYFFTTRFGLVGQLLRGIRELFVADTARLRTRLIEALGGETVPTNRCALAISTVDAHTGDVVRYVTADPLVHADRYEKVRDITVDMVLASNSIPLLFNGVSLDGRYLMDGGVLVNTPLAPVVALGAEEIVTVLVTGADTTNRPFANFGQLVERVADIILENSYNVDRKLLLERNRAGNGYRKVDLYSPIRPPQNADWLDVSSFLTFDHARLGAMREAGYRAADEWLAAGPRRDGLSVHRAPTLHLVATPSRVAPLAASAYGTRRSRAPER